MAVNGGAAQRTGRIPKLAQREGSSAWRSRDGYPFRGPLKVWSLLEMADAGIVPERIDDAKVVEGACDGV